MTKLLTKKQMVIDQLENVGFVSRNWALDHRISRLASIMFELKDWYDFHTKETKYDFLYVITY